LTTHPTREDKLALQLATTIEAEIKKLGWPVGRSLGSEPALMGRFEVSRAVMREAIRIVESHGVAEMRLGPGGGLTVTAPTPQAALETFSLLLDHAQATASDLFEVCDAILLASVALAAQRISEAGIAELRGLIEVTDDPSADRPRLRGCGDIHLAIVRATQNPALVLLSDVLAQMTASLTKRPDSHTDDEALARDHAAIITAIIAGDSALAQHRMRRHMSRIKQSLGIDSSEPVRLSD
jgi:DNA-binding FadR family transcriptional regulator